MSMFKKEKRKKKNSLKNYLKETEMSRTIH